MAKALYGEMTAGTSNESQTGPACRIPEPRPELRITRTAGTDVLTVPAGLSPAHPRKHSAPADDSPPAGKIPDILI